MTLTMQLGLFEPSAASHVVPEDVVPGQEVVTVKLEDAIPGGTSPLMYFEMSLLEAVQSNWLEVQEALLQLDPRTLA